MLAFLRDLMAHAAWAYAVFFHAWGKSSCRDQKELHRRAKNVAGSGRRPPPRSGHIFLPFFSIKRLCRPAAAIR
jgi:hypothetical protein